MIILLSIVILGLLICFFNLSIRLQKCEEFLNELKKSQLKESSEHIPQALPVPLANEIVEEKVSPPVEHSLVSVKTNESCEVNDIQKKQFKIPEIIKENWIGAFGSIALVIGAVFFSLTSEIMQLPEARVSALIIFSLMLFGICLKLKNQTEWISLCNWLKSIAGALILFSTIGASTIEGLRFIYSPIYATVFLCIGIAINLMLALITSYQTVASFHVILSLLAFCCAPQSLVLLPMGTLVALIGLVSAYRARWDLNILWIVIAFFFQNVYWTSNLQDQFHPWMHLIGIACSLIVGLFTAMIPYSNKFAPQNSVRLPLLAHLFNWGLLTLNILNHSQFLKWTPIILGIITISGFILANLAKKKGIYWLYKADTVCSQLVALATIISLSHFSIRALDIAILILIETIVFSLTIKAQKEIFFVRIGYFFQCLITFIALIISLQTLKSSINGDQLPIIFRMGCVFLLNWVYYIFNISKKSIIDDPRFILNNEQSLKNPFSLSAVLGNFFFISICCLEPDLKIVQTLTLLTIASLANWRKQNDDLTSNISMIMAMVFIHIFMWSQLLVIDILIPTLPSIFSDINFLGLIVLDLYLITGKFLEFDNWKRSFYTPVIYFLGFQIGYLVYVFTRRIDPLIPEIAFLGFAILILEAGKRISKFSKWSFGAKEKIAENFIQVGLAFILVFLVQFSNIHQNLTTMWHGIPLIWALETFGFFTLLYWTISYPRNLKYSKWTHLVLNHLIEICLAFYSFCIIEEVPPVCKPLFWIIIAIGLLIGSLHFNWPKKIFGYSLIFFFLTIVHNIFIGDILTKHHPLTFIAIALQFFYAYLVQSNKKHIEEITMSNRLINFIYRQTPIIIIFPAFFCTSIIFAYNFEKTILNLMWVGLIGIYLSVGLVIKSKRTIQIGMAALAYCCVRLLFYDLMQTNLTIRSLVFIGIGIMMLGISAIFKKYKHRIDANEKA